VEVSGMRTDPVISWMEANDVAVTRDNYIALNWGRDVPDPWTAEDEMELPEQLQDWDQFESVDGEFIQAGRRA
jgi:hypothetical protein